MPEGQRRMCLPSWLRGHIDSGKIPGLNWLSKSEEMFKIPWKHSSKHDWNESDSLIFKMWAQHTGRFREGVDKEDWPGWKTRFRCALNKLPDFDEVKNLNRLDSADPYKVYKFVPKKVSTLKQESAFRKPQHCYQKEMPLQREIIDNRTEGRFEAQSTVPLSVEMLMNSQHGHIKREVITDDEEDLRKRCKAERSIQSLGSDLKDLDVKDLMFTEVQSVPGVVIKDDKICLVNDDEEDMDTSDENLVVDEEIYPTDDQTGAPTGAIKENGVFEGQKNGRTLQCLNLVLPMRENGPFDYEMSIKFCYRHKEVGTINVSSPKGCRLYFGRNIQNNTDIGKALFGDPDAVQIHFPYTNEAFVSHKQEQLTNHLLSNMERGIVLHCENKDIYATRFSTCTVFVASPHCDKNVMKLKRDGTSMKIFDYNGYFLPALQRYLNGDGPKPSAEVLLGFGQKFSLEKNPYSDLLLSATVYHEKSYHDLNQVCFTSPLSPDIELSKPDSLDRYMDKLKEC